MMMMKRNNVDLPSRLCSQGFEGDQSLLTDHQKKFSSQTDLSGENLWEFRMSLQQKQYLNKEMVMR